MIYITIIIIITNVFIHIHLVTGNITRKINVSFH